MKPNSLIRLICLLGVVTAYPQFHFSGQLSKSHIGGEVYLSLVEDCRKMNGIYDDQIIAITVLDSLRRFKFIGDQLSSSNRIYRIHVDYCNNQRQSGHFNGLCKDFRQILFIANNRDTINFPVAFEDEVFCEVRSTNPSTGALIRIDSLNNLMRYDYAGYPSEINQELNNRKWFPKLQEFGRYLKEPLAELYIYSFLTDKSHQTYAYYINDLSESLYYSNLGRRLAVEYPDTYYLRQYTTELSADRLVVDEFKGLLPWWVYASLLLLVLSLLINVYMYHRLRSKTINGSMVPLDVLSNQESVIFDLLIQGKSNKEIATAQFISLSTVKSHLNTIYRKLKIGNRKDAISLYTRKNSNQD
jgi:DNA-binding CsgD family transcriptional regulator